VVKPVNIIQDRFYIHIHNTVLTHGQVKPEHNIDELEVYKYLHLLPIIAFFSWMDGKSIHFD